MVVRNILKIADTSKDAKKIIKMGEVFVDGKYRKDHKYSVGLMDAVSIPKLKLNYRVVPTNKGLELIEIKASEKNKKICKIEGKVSVKISWAKKGKKENKIQLNLHDGRNILVEATDANKYKVGDSLLLTMPEQKIDEILKFEKGSSVIVTQGKNIGRIGTIEDVIVTPTKDPTKTICNMGNEKLEVIKDYILVAGKTEPIIQITGEN